MMSDKTTDKSTWIDAARRVMQGEAEAVLAASNASPTALRAP